MQNSRHGSMLRPGPTLRTSGSGCQWLNRKSVYSAYTRPLHVIHSSRTGRIAFQKCLPASPADICHDSVVGKLLQRRLNSSCVPIRLSGDMKWVDAIQVVPLGRHPTLWNSRSLLNRDITTLRKLVGVGRASRGCRDRTILIEPLLLRIITGLSSLRLTGQDLATDPSPMT